MWLFVMKSDAYVVVSFAITVGIHYDRIEDKDGIYNQNHLHVWKLVLLITIEHAMFSCYYTITIVNGACLLESGEASSLSQSPPVLCHRSQPPPVLVFWTAARQQLSRQRRQWSRPAGGEGEKSLCFVAIGAGCPVRGAGAATGN